jgi:UDP-N-acetylglucosamine acyltransferase
MVGGFSKVAHDVAPFTIVDGPHAKPFGLNVVGLRRAGVDAQVRGYLQQAFRLTLHTTRNLSDALADAREIVPPLPEVQEFLYAVELSGRTGRHLDPKYAKLVRA